MANNITILDFNTDQRTVKTTDNAGVHTPHQNIDSLPALPAGTNNIGDVDIASPLPAGTNNIGDVDVLTLPALPAGTNLIGDVIVNDIEDGSATSVMDAVNNAIQVNVVAGGGTGGTALADDGDFTAGSTLGTPFEGVYQSTATNVTDGDVGIARITQKRALLVSHETPAGDSMVDDTNDALQVNVVAGVGSDYTEGDTDATISGPAVMMEVAADTLQPIQGTVADGLLVNLGSNNDVTLAALPGVDTEGSALGSGMLIQGDDGTDRTNVLVDTDGHLQVDVLSGGGGGTQYTEDDAGAANPVGTQPVMIRQDTPATLVSLDGDVVAQRATNYGGAFVQVIDSSGNFIDTFGGSGGTSAADDADFVAGTTQGTPAMGVYESTPTTVTDGDMGVVGISSDRRMLTDTEITAALPAGDNNIGNVDVVTLPALAAGTNNIGDVDVASITAGETHVGQVGGEAIVKEFTPSTDTSTQTAGDVIFATEELTSMVRVNAGTGVLQSLVILDKDDQGAEMDIFILKTNVALGTEGAAISITDANADEILAVINVETTDYTDLVESQIAIVGAEKLGQLLVADTAATSLWIAAATRGTPTYTASGLTFKLGVLQN